jgi:hypothetical protein
LQRRDHELLQTIGLPSVENIFSPGGDQLSELPPVSGIDDVDVIDGESFRTRGTGNRTVVAGTQGGTMELIITGVAAGVLGTLVMDALNHLFARAGVITEIDVKMIGRMAAGWARGRFRYRHPDEMKQVANELLYGYLTHYTIGVALAGAYVLGWDLLIGGPASPVWALAYGVATTVASLFFVYPSMGLGACGRRSPEGIKSPLSSLANHLFYGVGMAVAVALL